MKDRCPGSRGNTALNVVLCLVVVGVVLAVIAPVFMRTGGGGSGRSTCQCNLKQISVAIKQYLTDWDQTFPTNKPANAVSPVAEVQLALPTDTDPVTNKPVKFATVNGVKQISWVGALYDHIEAVAAPDGASSVWKCPAVESNDQYGSTEAIRKSAAVTYVMNFNLVGQQEGIVRDARTLMLCRETDRLVAGCCRGGKMVGSVMKIVEGAKDVPSAPFLCVVDENMPGVAIKSRLHQIGSNVLFADGHVKTISSQAFGPTNTAVWDKDAGSWVNAGVPKGLVSLMP